MVPTTAPSMTSSNDSRPECAPKYATRRRPERPTFGPRLAKIAELLGQPLMPWQRLVADVGGEYDPDTGIPYYREVDFTVPRQSGKTTVSLVWQIDRCVNWGRPQRSVFTAQDGQSAKEKWRDELFPLIESSPLRPLVRRITVGAADTAITWKTDSIIRVGSTSTAAGHGKTLHHAVLDEIWHDTDDRREQGLRPAMVTVPEAQLLVCSTAGTQASTVYNRKIAAGRRAVIEDSGQGVAYFEWSAPDGWDPADEESWWSFMPALGHTITPEVIRVERASMEPGEFRRAYGNVPTAGADVVIPESVWRRVSVDDCAPDPDGKLRFGLDVAEDRGSAAIVATDGYAFELLEHRSGLGWVVERCNEITRGWGGRVAVDFGGPAGVLADQLDHCDRLQGREVIQACGAMYDAIVESRVRFRSDADFDAAVETAVRKPVGDNWVWSRKASAKVIPLMAATLAYRGDSGEVLEGSLMA